MHPWTVPCPYARTSRSAKALDVIFCRNVVIYFDEPTQETVWRRFIDIMTPQARLYIGHSERVTGDDGRLVSDGLTVYRLKGAAR